MGGNQAPSGGVQLPSRKDLVTDGGDLVVTDASGQARIRLDKDTAGAFFFDQNGNLMFRYGAGVGGINPEGNLLLFQRDADQPTFHLDSGRGTAFIGGDNKPGQLVCVDEDNNQTVFVNGAAGQIIVGANSQDGTLFVRNGNNQPVIRLRGGNAGVGIGGGGENNPGTLVVRNGQNQIAIELNGEEGRLFVRNGNNQPVIRLDGGDGSIATKAVTTGTITSDSITTKAVITNGGDVLLKGGGSVRVEGGDVVLTGGDCAEDFEVAADVDATPGTVMVLNADGQLCPSTTPYDRRVAGIVAGAGDLKPGIILGRRTTERSTVPIALTGRVYCKVDATTTPIAVGDLLTTSLLPGLAMKATDPEAAFGAIIGKALKPLAARTGLIPVLVALQ